MFLQEAAGAVIMFALMRLSGLEGVWHRREIGFGRGLLVGMVLAAIYFRCGCIWVTVFLHGGIDIAGTIVTGIYVGDATVTDVVSSYTPLKLIGMIPYLIVLLVLLRGGKMEELLRRMNGESYYSRGCAPRRTATVR